MPLSAVKLASLVAISLVRPLSAYAWDGVDAATGNAVEIGKGNLVRSGQTIEIYDSGSGEYRDVDVESITRGAGSVEVEVYDSEAGEYRTLEMED
ncbi:DUF5334 domain-containing protein [Rhizobium sullae]|uniref:DUF5334 domain-containing protein n=1 Tax=Rhizobium sullae TaxID=50338 RepID=A0ABY5XI49_RHISU|nr:DUF5334 family protein [Rhizobium sullae]UWU14140.1 DUF5334 domain-containing protein [Rhizobium sullae]